MNEFKETLSQFYFGHPDDWLNSIILHLDDCPTWAKGTFETFVANLETTANVANVPFLMAHTSVNNAQFERIYTSERILSLKFEDKTEQKDRFEIAVERRRLQIENGETHEHERDEVLRFLKASNKNPNFSRAASELLSEALVMIWGAFEAFTSEYIRLLLNENPKLAITLLENDATKKYFPSRIVSLDSLVTHDFNFASSMGDVIFSDRHLDSLPMIKDMVSALSIGGTELYTALSSKQLWILWQRRHLIVHKRGIVDQTYLRKTNEALPLGSRLTITRTQLEEAFAIVIAIVARMIAVKAIV